MFCPKCGNQLNDNAAFCNVCGTNLQGGAPARAAAAPSHLISGKSVSIKDSNFLFVVIAAIFAFFATVLMHCPVINIGNTADAVQGTLFAAGGAENAIGQIIFTILTFISLAYLFLPYIPGVPLKINIFNYIAPIAVLFFQMILFIVGGLTHDLASYGVTSMSLDGWLFWLSTIVSIGLLTYELIKFIIKK